MSTPTNVDRAVRAADALLAAGVDTGVGVPGRPDSVYPLRDLLADLMHYCDLYAVDFDDELRIARYHYRAETEEEAYDRHDAYEED